MQVIQLQGNDKRLYELVASGDNPQVLRQNHNYPFRTTENFA